MRVPRLISTLAVISAASLILAACGGEETTTEEPTDTEAPDDGEAVGVGLVYDIGGRGDQSFNDAAAAGLDQAEAEFNLETNELEPTEGGENRGELLRLISGEGFDLIFGVGFAFEEAMESTAPDFPDVNYGFIDGFLPDLDADSNVVALGFAEHEGSFLVGAAAALKSETGRVGFIGGVQIDLIERFEAGFVAGAREVNPDIEIDITYISQPPDFSGFTDPASGREIALGMYGNGADVVYHAAGGSGLGLFEAAKAHTDSTGDHVWAIGVDSDQYLTADEELQPHILTSMLKRVDVAVYETIAAQVEGNFEGGYRTFDLSTDGVGYSTTGGFVDDIVDQLEELKQQVIDGDIEVPDSP
jgi:basic membrane protein A and related proteins